MTTIQISNSDKDYLLGVLDEAARDPAQSKRDQKRIEKLTDRVERASEDPQIVQRAEDIRAIYHVQIQMILGELPSPFSEEEMRVIGATTGVLCWLLGQEHITSFPKNVLRILDFLSEEGYEEFGPEGMRGRLESFINEASQ
jgi:hypothetical protein